MNLPSLLGYRTTSARLQARRSGLSMITVLILLGMAMLRAGMAQVHELHVAAAADLQPVMPLLTSVYQQKTGTKVIVSYGSSGALVGQITNGAPFDLFLGADFVFPERLVAAGLTDASAPLPYARGTLVLWARKDSPLQPLTMDKLGDPRVKSLAIADEAHAPYGRAAVSALQKLGLYDGLRSRLLIGENVAQTGQYAATGNAQAALISLTLAHSQQYASNGSYVLVPDVYPEIRQCAVVLKRPGHTQEAHQFLDWILSSEVQSKLADMGLKAVQ